MAMRAFKFLADGVGRELDVTPAEEARHFEVLPGFTQGYGGAAVGAGNDLPEIAKLEFHVTAALGAGHFRGGMGLGAPLANPGPSQADDAAQKQVKDCGVQQEVCGRTGNSECLGEVSQVTLEAGGDAEKREGQEINQEIQPKPEDKAELEWTGAAQEAHQRNRQLNAGEQPEEVGQREAENRVVRMNQASAGSVRQGQSNRRGQQDPAAGMNESGEPLLLSFAGHFALVRR